MKLFDKILKDNCFDYLIKECNDRGFIINESVDNNSYISTIMHKDSDSKLNISITESKFQAYIMDKNNNIIESIENDIASDDELKSSSTNSLNTFDVIKDIDDSDILNEDDESSSEYKSIPIGLDELKNDVKSIADKLKDLSNLSDNVEVISVIMDLSNSAYSLILDIDSALETYNEIMELPDEDIDPDSDVDASVEESKARINLANAMMSVNSVSKMGIIKESKYKEFVNICKNLF